MNQVVELRIRPCNQAPIGSSGKFVLYWMIAHRRTHWNFSLQRAVEWARLLNKPLVILEALRCGYPWASDRFHWFILEGMKDNAARLKNTGVFYYPYLEPEPGAGKGLLRKLGKRACVIITDDFPAFFLPRMVESAAGQSSVLMEKVDSNGLLPIRWTERVFLTAYSFRRFLQNNIGPHLHSFPSHDPLAERVRPYKNQISVRIFKRWPPAHNMIQSLNKSFLNSFPIDHTVSPSTIRGGERAASRTLNKFLKEGQKCRVVAGPLMGLEGVVAKARGATRLLLQVDMLGQAASVEIDVDMTEPID